MRAVLPCVRVKRGVHRALPHQATFMINEFASMTEYPVLQKKAVPASRAWPPPLDDKLAADAAAKMELAVIDQQQGNARVVMALSVADSLLRFEGHA